MDLGRLCKKNIKHTYESMIRTHGINNNALGIVSNTHM
jgi:hypothetical protein